MDIDWNVNIPRIGAASFFNGITFDRNRNALSIIYGKMRMRAEFSRQVKEFNELLAVIRGKTEPFFKDTRGEIETKTNYDLKFRTEAYDYFKRYGVDMTNQHQTLFLTLIRNT